MRAAFTGMEHATKQEYELVTRMERKAAAQTPDRVIALLKTIAEIDHGCAIDPLTHSLQSATRAHRDGRPEDYVVAALLHDIGLGVAPFNHDTIAADLIRPYVSDRLHWVVEHHGVFQMFYYGHHLGMDRNLRDRYRDHPYYEDTVEFCHHYDQNCFDPDYDTMPLDFFEPIVRRVLAAPKTPA